MTLTATFSLSDIPQEPQLAPKKLGITSTASDRHPAEDPSCSNHPPSFRQLVDYIRCYVAEETEKPLELRVSSNIAHSHDVKKGLGGRCAKYEDGILTISPMPSRLHNSCAFWFAQTWEDKIKPLLSSSEAAGVQTGPMETFLRRSRHDDQGDASLGKKPSLMKEPDLAWGFCKPSPGKAMSRVSPVPRIVLEAGFTETPEELAIDVEQWLKGTKSVQLVFVVKISESSPTDENSPGRTERIGDLKNRFGCGKTTVSGSFDKDEGAYIGSQSSDDSEEAQDGIAKELVVDDWVGPLTAYCEVWERFGGGYRRRGRRTVSRFAD